ncbi:MAG: hypothetical protein R6V77_07690 [Candidatus Cloacimonadaceae bacterium]
MFKHNLNQVTFGTAIRAPEDIKVTNLEEVIGDIRDGRWERYSTSPRTWPWCARV